MIKYFASLALLLTVFVSCRPIKTPVFTGIENVRVDKIGWGESSLILDMSYQNPNGFSAKLKEAEGDAWMDSTFLGHFEVDSTVNIPANSSFIVPVGLKVDMKKLLQNSITAVLNKEVEIRLTGTAKAGRNGVYRRFPINYKGKQDLSKIIKL